MLLEGGFSKRGWDGDSLAPEIKGKNRWAFALASYNVGLGHIHDAQSLAIKRDGKLKLVWRRL